jgi:hypothetical protein
VTQEHIPRGHSHRIEDLLNRERGDRHRDVSAPGKVYLCVFVCGDVCLERGEGEVNYNSPASGLNGTHCNLLHLIHFIRAGAEDRQREDLSSTSCPFLKSTPVNSLS